MAEMTSSNTSVSYNEQSSFDKCSQIEALSMGYSDHECDAGHMPKSSACAMNHFASARHKHAIKNNLKSSSLPPGCAAYMSGSHLSSSPGLSKRICHRMLSFSHSQPKTGEFKELTFLYVVAFCCERVVV